jgi:hypothetical protein
MRPTRRVAPEDSITLAARQLRENCGVLVPVVENDRLLGVVTEAQLTNAFADGLELSDAVSNLMVPWATIPPYATGAEALRTFSSTDLATLLVVDDQNRVMGLLSASDLLPRKRIPIRPHAVGGMASPFGVYLTSGTASGGVSKWALVATGATMYCLVAFAGVSSVLLFRALPQGTPAWVSSDVSQLLVFLLIFGISMRLLPMAGIHASEHKVVHAIERGEELQLDIVKRMPRVHPRCGTNFATGVGIFLVIFAISWIPEDEVRALVGGIAALLFWRRLGSLAQYYVTTRPPSRKHLEDGIRAGEQLLENYTKVHCSRPSVQQWIWNSGLLHVLAGSLICSGIALLIAHVFHLELPT